MRLGERESLACKIGPKFKLCTRSLKTDWRNNAQNEITKHPPQVLQPDEYLIQDLQQTGQNVEYELIIEG